MPSVLAAVDDLSLLWTLLSRSPLSNIFPTTVCATDRRVLGSIAGTLLLAVNIRHDKPNSTVAARIHAVSGPATIFNSRLYLVAEEP